MSFSSVAARRWALLSLTVLTFFLLLGSRSLNEPDEGRYTEVAREMVESGDWLVPHFWYLPHLSKPPMTYWLVAISLKCFGQNEWAARLPAALAGLSGVWATYLLGCSCGGRRTGLWAALILQSSLLYFGMARMLTTDIFLTQFVVWAVYFFWRGWQAPPSERAWASAWHLAGWGATALGFLTKGPVALAIPLVPFTALLVYRRKTFAVTRIPLVSVAGGLALFLIIVLPWFLAIFQRFPQAVHFMIVGQAAGHLVGTVKNRHGNPFYFFAILAVGFSPWTILLGWLWRRAYWRKLDERSRDAWLLLTAWAVFTFTLFSFSEAKLPAYILPIFPALAVLVAWRFFAGDGAWKPPPRLAWYFCLLSSFLLPALFPLLARFAFHNELSAWLKWQMPLVVLAGVVVIWRAKNWEVKGGWAATVGVTLLGMMIVVAEIPEYETSLRANQSLKALGRSLAANFKTGDEVVCWGKLPQGLPFYSGNAISPANQPFFGGMDLTQLPFEFPGNRELLGDRLLPDENALAAMLQEKKRVWIVGYGDALESFQGRHSGVHLQLVLHSGQCKLFSND